jgi:glyoxylase-like metal-dependent hydrolase (beta-lactamase superfamily II)
MATEKRISFAAVDGLRAGRFDLAVNTAAACYRLGNTLIDSGCANRWPQVRNFVAERPLQQVLLSHHHEDHSGNAARISQLTGARVLAPAAGLSQLAEGWPMRPYQHLLFGRPQSLKAEPLPDRLELGAGLCLEVIATPGHATDLVCFLEPTRGWLFSGDLFISETTRFLRQDEDLALHLDSLRRLTKLHFQTIFCAHRGVITDGQRALTAKLEHLEQLQGEARRLQQQGLSVTEITRRLLGREQLVSLATGFHFSKRNLINACLNRKE